MTKFIRFVLVIFTTFPTPRRGLPPQIAASLEVFSMDVFGGKKNVAENVKFSLTKQVFWDTNILVVL